MSIFRCPYCGSSNIFEDFNGEALKCGDCEEYGVEDDFIARSKKIDKIRRVKKFDDELPFDDEPNNDDNSENVEDDN